ncbi:uncharacterized protein Dvar_25020 [Desulfosarcina variabilis str. Montpellier]|uniref:hypothetical protein n=1 Tax=Desulfosarcina variabilis TaxID=2300 RepID=UPI003AFAD0E3
MATSDRRGYIINEMEIKKIQQIFDNYSDEALVEEALSPRENYQEGVYDLIAEICKERGLENKINRVKSEIIEKNGQSEEKDRINSTGPYDFFRLSTIQTKIQELSDEELIDALNHENEEIIQEIIKEEFFNRGIEDSLLLKKQNPKIQNISINPFRVMKEGFQFFIINPNLLLLVLIILITEIVFKLNLNLNFF